MLPTHRLLRHREVGHRSTHNQTTARTHTSHAYRLLPVACVVCPLLHHLVSTVEKLLFNWKNVRVSVYFKESRAVYEALLVHQVTPIPIWRPT